MCGLAGIVGYRDGQPVDKAELLRIRDAMANRGPDGAGLWIGSDGTAGLAHRRLSIIDLSANAAQPMRSADGRFVIVFNGEIYNYRALREELVRGGAALRSQSDTEVIVELYAREGAAALPKLRGMFAIAIWDERERRLFLARDAFGIKPLYYADDGGVFRFASQVRALLAGAVGTAPDAAGHAGFRTWGFVPEPFTLYRSIHALPAGSSMTIDARGAGTPQPFFDLVREYRLAEEAGAALDGPRAWERLADALSDSVAHHLVADVPVGVFLSAGIDSTAIATLAARLGHRDLRCVTLGFEPLRGGAMDESDVASTTARALGARHAIEWLDREGFLDALPDVMAAMDQPTTDGINTYFVARAAARQGLKVALSGLGGDELFGGYPSFRDVPRIVRRFGFLRHAPSWLGRAARRMSAPLVGRMSSPKYAGLAEYGATYAGAYLLRRGLFMPWELEKELGATQAREGRERLATLSRLAAAHAGLRSDASIVSALEVAWYMRGQLLRDADWAGMAHSLEIRVPFVDVAVLRAAAPLLAAGKVRSKRDVAVSLRLPPEVMDRPKTGFLAPVREWTLGSARGARDRGLRGWARKVSRQIAGDRSVLALVTDAYGASGGIALCMRDLISAVGAGPGVRRVLALPRRVPGPVGGLPDGVRFETCAAGGKLRFALAAARAAAGSFDAVVCGHINLLPVARLAARRARAPLVLVVHGIDAWKPTASALANRITRSVDAVVAVSGVTRQRFLAWSGLPPDRCIVLPNALHPGTFSPGPRPRLLAERHGIADDAKVIMTLGRLASSERYKGVDEVLEAMPSLLSAEPRLVYVVVGEGDDRERLERKAAQLGLARHVVFAGFAPEDEKPEYYRLADAYVMPSRGEGFGFVFLEAMASGLPVVGSRLDGGREALLDGRLGRLVDPDDAAELARAVLDALASPKQVPAGLEHFHFDRFACRWHRLLDRVCLLH